jgi:Protein of unknown function (DUF2924)
VLYSVRLVWTNSSVHTFPTALGRPVRYMLAATPGASLPLDAPLLSIVANLEGLDLDGLRRQWRAQLGGEAPAHLSRWLLMKVLAYRLQSDAFGGLDKSIQRILRSGKEDGVGAPFDRSTPQTRDGVGLKVGALLVRKWNGRLERVMILEEGFAWNGQTFGSLSQIAKAMTGDQLERPTLLRPSSGKGFRSRYRHGSPKEQRSDRRL